MHAAHKKLVARGAAITEQIKALEAELKTIKARLPLTDGRYSVPGAELLITTANRSTLDSAIVKALLTPGQIVQATKVAPSTTWKFRTVAAEEVAQEAQAA